MLSKRHCPYRWSQLRKHRAVQTMLWDLYRPNRILLANATSLVLTTAINSGLGFFYWWVAAHFYTPEALGFASASISAMMLLGTVGMLGLGTLLIGELQHQPNNAGSLITTSLLAVGGASLVLGIGFALLAPHLSNDFAPLGTGLQSILLFALGAGITSIVLVLDQIFISYLRGDLQLGRNVLMAVSKLAMLIIFGLYISEKAGLIIFLTWVLGILLSLLAVCILSMHCKVRFETWRPQLNLLRKLRHAALAHHTLNLALQAPSLIFPIVITIALSASMNASFYVAWMIASFALVGPSALTTVLYATGSANQEILKSKILITLKLAILIGIVATIFLWVGGGSLLGFFGSTYATDAEWGLRILVLGVFPGIIKLHYVAVCRILGRVSDAAKLMALGAIIELTLGAAGAKLGGLTGLSVGWLLAVFVEAIFAAPYLISIMAMLDRAPDSGSPFQT